MATGHIPIFEIHIPKPITLFRQRMAAEREDDYSSDEFSSDEEVGSIKNCLLCTCVSRTRLQRVIVWCVLIGINSPTWPFLQLQEEFARGELKPGLIARAAPPKTYTNNVVCEHEFITLIMSSAY